MQRPDQHTYKPCVAGKLRPSVCSPTQEAILEEADAGVSGRVFDLALPELGPYNLAFTRSGRHMLLGGRRGHLALLDWQQRHLVAEVQVRPVLAASRIRPSSACLCGCRPVSWHTPAASFHQAPATALVAQHPGRGVPGWAVWKPSARCI